MHNAIHIMTEYAIIAHTSQHINILQLRIDSNKFNAAEFHDHKKRSRDKIYL